MLLTRFGQNLQKCAGAGAPRRTIGKRPTRATQDTVNYEFVCCVHKPEETGAFLVQCGATMTKDALNQPADDARSAADRRKHRRAALKLGVRFLLADGSEHSGTVTDISLGGMAVTSDAKPQASSIVIAYVEGFGRLEGMVSRLNGRGFAVRLTLSAIKREKLEERLTTNKKTSPHEGRRHERESTMATATRIIRSDGRSLACRVIDLSLGGVSVETAEWPALGEQVVVGKMRGRVVRHHELGIAIEFTDIPPSRGSLAEQLVSGDRSAA